ncbi:histidinol-phosphate aminotransferase family protein, partial [Streptomyces sp. NPDC059477]
PRGRGAGTPRAPGGPPLTLPAPPPGAVDRLVGSTNGAGLTPPGVPAHGGLTAAQVRGTNGLSPAPAAGWPNPAGWPNTG